AERKWQSRNPERREGAGRIDDATWRPPRQSRSTLEPAKGNPLRFVRESTIAKKRTLPALTERQTQVLERLGRRLPIKVIAAELAVSESRVNQHVRALKQVFSARDLSDLVARYRAAADAPAESPFRKAAGRKNHLPA